jgi:hypothetical protein
MCVITVAMVNLKGFWGLVGNIYDCVFTTFALPVFLEWQFTSTARFLYSTTQLSLPDCQQELHDSPPSSTTFNNFKLFAENSIHG